MGACVVSTRVLFVNRGVENAACGGKCALCLPRTSARIWAEATSRIVLAHGAHQGIDIRAGSEMQKHPARRRPVIPMWGSEQVPFWAGRL